MRENKAKILSAKQTLIKEAKNKKLLVICYAFALYKLIKLQITNTKVISLAQALNIIKNKLVHLHSLVLGHVTLCHVTALVQIG
jgi:hypothetical protein